jgi:nitrite reductase/ring-hydroxylating ferredoxin subunit
MEQDLGKIERRMRSVLAEIKAEYDFSLFSINDFIGWLERRRNRPIARIPYHIDHPDIYGVWLADECKDYIVYESNTLPVHQVHIQLHECAHMLCNHSAQTTLTSQDLRTLFRGASIDLETGAILQSSDQSQRSELAELEAETLASLIKRQVLQEAGVGALSNASSNENWTTYIEALKLD